jgi:hypothetical protein
VNEALKIILAAIALPLFCVGCAHDRDGWNDHSLLRSIEFPEDTIPALNQAANESANSQEDRARAIFTLFGRYVQPGCSSAEFHRIAADVRWLDGTGFYRVGAYAGWMPLGGLLHGSVFELYPFKVGTDKRGSCWHIYFRLSGDNLQQEDALSFLRGTLTSDSTVKMEEFALCLPHSIFHPDRSIGRIEKFSPRGVHVYEEMGR